MTPEKEDRFRKAVEENRDRIYRLCCSHVRRTVERSDVFQEIMINIWKNLDSFEGKSKLSTWIYRVAVNTCLDHLRSEGRRRRLFAEEAEGESEPADGAAAPDIALEHQDQVQRLYACINELPEIDRTLVSLFLEDMTTVEMAEVLGISEANVRVKLHRVRGNLRVKWERVHHGPE